MSSNNISTFIHSLFSGNLGLNLGLGGAANDLTSNLTSTLTSLAAANQNTAYPLNQLSSQSGLGQSNILSGMAAYSQGMQSQSKYGQCKLPILHYLYLPLSIHYIIISYYFLYVCW
jgi:hypothetical protein